MTKKILQFLLLLATVLLLLANASHAYWTGNYNTGYYNRGGTGGGWSNSGRTSNQSVKRGRTFLDIARIANPNQYGAPFSRPYPLQPFTPQGH